MAHVKNSSPKKKSKQLLSKETLVARKVRSIKNTTEDLTQKIYLNVQYRDKEFAKLTVAGNWQSTERLQDEL